MSNHDLKSKMKAIVFSNYGSPDVLELKHVDKPTPKENEILVHIRASSVNAGDWHIMRGDPYAIRFVFGIRRPSKQTILGNDFAGIVEAVGKNVTHFQPGEEVFGHIVTGAFAEYVCIPENMLALKPKNITFEQAAAVPCGGLTALQALRAGGVEPGKKVLINGAAGGVGSFAVQIAKTLQLEVTAVCSTRNVDMVRSIGADHVIDYTKENFTLGETKYDLILDIVGNHYFSDIRKVISPKGTYIPVGGPGGGLLGSTAYSLVTLLYSQFLSQKVTLILTSPNREDLSRIKDLVEEGKITPIIDRQYTLSETPDALRYIEEGHARGKIVINVPE